MLSTVEVKKNSSFIRLPKFLSFLLKKRSKYLVENDYEKFVLDQSVKSHTYLNIIANSANLKTLQTSQRIQPDLLGGRGRDVLRTYGRPGSVYRERDITVFIYKWRLKRLKNNCRVHFYKNRVFMINHHYKSTNSDYKPAILTAVAQKYLNGGGSYPELLNCKIIDEINNIIFIEDDLFGLKISYVQDKESAWFSNMLKEASNKSENLKISTRLKERFFYDKI